MIRNLIKREYGVFMICLVVLMFVVGGCGQEREATLAGHKLSMEKHQSIVKDFYNFAHVANKDLTKAKMKDATTETERENLIDEAFNYEAQFAYLLKTAGQADMLDHQTSIYIMSLEPFLSKTYEEWKEAYQDETASSTATTQAATTTSQ